MGCDEMTSSNIGFFRCQNPNCLGLFFSICCFLLIEAKFTNRGKSHEGAKAGQTVVFFPELAQDFNLKLV